MNKQVLSIEQMQHLQELGLDTSNASACYDACDEDGEKQLMWKSQLEESDMYDDSFSIVPAYTLQDVLELLPDKVTGADGKPYYLYIDLAVGFIGYDRREMPDILTGVSFTKIPMIDAAYKLLCWCIEQGYVKTGKEE